MLRQINEKYIEELRAVPACLNKKFVLGEGNSDTPGLMMIGEAPGAQEVLQGRPFVGSAGRNLNDFLKIMGAIRDNIYITNAVKIRPTSNGRDGQEKNRTPTFNEVALFLPWLRDEIQAVNPAILVTLGNTALRALIGETASIGDKHGQLLHFPGIIALYPLYHPAAIIYNRALANVYKEDVVRLRKLINNHSWER